MRKEETIIDLHGKRFIEGKVFLLQSINRAFNQLKTQIQIIHGFNNGTAFKEYIRSQEFDDDLEESGIFIIRKRRNRNPGITTVMIEVP